MYDSARKVNLAVKKAYAEVSSALEELRADIRPGPPMDETVDALFAVRKACEMVEDLRKQLSGLDTALAKLYCIEWSRMEDPPDRLKTEYATAYDARVKLMSALPRYNKEPEKFRALMEHFEVPARLWDVGDGEPLVKPHYPGVMEYATRRAENGQSFPPGMDERPFAVYAVSIRKRKEIT